MENLTELHIIVRTTGSHFEIKTKKNMTILDY